MPQSTAPIPSAGGAMMRAEDRNSLMDESRARGSRQRTSKCCGRAQKKTLILRGVLEHQGPMLRPIAATSIELRVQRR